MKRHLSKKVECQALSEDAKSSFTLLAQLNQPKSTNFLCLCGKHYQQQCNLYTHRKKCEKYLESLVSTNNHDSINGDNVTLTNASNSSSGGISGHHNTLTQKNNCDNTTIVINNFGCENLSFLTPEFIEKCTCYLSMGVTSMTKAIHLNVHHPENHNMKVTNAKSPFVKVMKDEEWIYKDKKDALRELIDKVSYIQKCYFDENRTGIKERWNSYKRDAIEIFHERLENEDKELWKKLMKDLYLLFLNDKDITFPKSRKKPKISTKINAVG
jgi:hypothetical protein